MSQSDEYRRQAANVMAFLNAYKRLISLSTVVTDPVFFSHRLREPKPGLEGEFYIQFTEVARLAGHACVGPIGVIDEVANWQQSLKDVEVLSAKDVIEVCETMLGILHERARTLSQRDRTLAGRVALFVGFPARVSSIVSEEHPRLGKAAFGVGIASQLVVGVMIGVLTAGAVALVSVLWAAAT